MSYEHPTEEEMKLRAILDVALRRVPRPERHGSDHERVVAEVMGQYVRQLWASGWLPLKTPKGWVAGLSVRCTDMSTGVGAGRIVGPKRPSRYRPEYSRFTSTSTWNQ